MARMALMAAEAAEGAVAPTAKESVLAMVKKILTPRGALVSEAVWFVFCVCVR